MKLMDITNFIALSLYNEHGKLHNNYKIALEYLSNHYFRGQYYQYLYKQGNIKCADTNCETCMTQTHEQCDICKEGYGLDSNYQCQPCASTGCGKCSLDYTVCDECAWNYFKYGGQCNAYEYPISNFLQNIDGGIDFGEEKYGPRNS
jgi:hypothetical protein